VHALPKLMPDITKQHRDVFTATCTCIYTCVGPAQFMCTLIQKLLLKISHFASWTKSEPSNKVYIHVYVHCTYWPLRDISFRFPVLYFADAPFCVRLWCSFSDKRRIVQYGTKLCKKRFRFDFFLNSCFHSFLHWTDLIY
jgi:hypothetical protein